MSDKDQAVQIATIVEHAKHTDEKLGGISDTLKEVLEQTTKTNGRVNKLEAWRQAIIVVSGFLWSLALIYIGFIIN